MTVKFCTILLAGKQIIQVYFHIGGVLNFKDLTFLPGFTQGRVISLIPL